MNFFCTKKHYNEWREGAGSNLDIYGLPLADAVAVARVLFGPGEDREWARYRS